MPILRSFSPSVTGFYPKLWSLALTMVAVVPTTRRMHQNQAAGRSADSWLRLIVPMPMLKVMPVRLFLNVATPVPLEPADKPVGLDPIRSSTVSESTLATVTVYTASIMAETKEGFEVSVA